MYQTLCFKASITVFAEYQLMKVLLLPFYVGILSTVAEVKDYGSKALCGDNTSYRHLLPIL